MVEYDPSVIREFVQQLYKKSHATILSNALIGVTVGALGGYAVGAYGGYSQYKEVSCVGAGVVGFMIGAGKGSSKAFAYKLQAQTLLVQLQIEINTRPKI